MGHTKKLCQLGLAVLDTCQYLEKNGFQLTYLPVDSSGLVSTASLECAIQERTILVSIRFTASIPDVELNGHPTQRLPNNLNMSFSCVEAEALLMELQDVAISSGAACTSTSVAPSHVLKALGLSDEQVYSSVRFGLGRFNTEEEIEYVIQRVGQAVNRLRNLSPAWRNLHPKEVANVETSLA